MGTIIVNSDGTQTDERTGQILPPQPSGYHVYDADAHMWVDARTLDEAKADAWIRIKRARAVAEFADFTCDGAVYQVDKPRITGATQHALLSQVAGEAYLIDWILSDNSIVKLDAAGMIAVGTALGEHVASVFAIGRELRQQVAAAASIEQLDAIVWPARDVE